MTTPRCQSGSRRSRTKVAAVISGVMRWILLLGLAACGSVGAPGKSRLRVERLGPEPLPLLMLGEDRLVLDGEAGTLARVGDGGVVRWKREIPGSMVQVKAPGDELWFLAREDIWRTEIVRIDAARGLELGRAPTPRSLGSWLQRGAALYNVDSYAVARVDPATGNHLWEVKGDFVEFHAQPAPSALWVRCKGGVCGFAADSGALIATLPDASWPMLTPDGGTLVLQGEHAAGVYDAATGALRWSASEAPGARLAKTAVTERWLAVLSSGSDDDDPDHVQVFAIGGGAPVWSVSSAKGAYLEYVAAGGDLVVWYDSKDAAIHAVRLPDGARAKVYQLHETFVMATEATGMAPAVPDSAPEVEGDRVLVKDFGKVHGFRVY